MDEIYIETILGGLFLFFVIRTGVRLPGIMLNRKFVSLGNFTNLTKEDFIRKAGTPSATHNLDDGAQLCQWYAGGYKMAIIFDRNGKFVKIHSEIQAS